MYNLVDFMLYEFFEKVYALEKQGKPLVKLNVGEPDTHPSGKVLRAAYTAMREHKDKYGSAAGEPDLRERLAELHGCKTSNVVITPGSKFGIYALMKLLLGAGNAMMFSPHWTAYELMCKSVGATANIVKLDSSNWNIDFEQLEQRINADTKMIVLNSPGNPTSRAWDIEDEAHVVELARKRGIVVVADDAYRDLCFDKRKERQFEDGLCIVNTFSKTFGMTGWRLGYMVVPEELAKKVIAFNQITITSAPVFLQLAALKALEEKEKTANKLRNLCKKRAMLAASMLKGKMQFVKPDAGFYLFPEVPGGDGTVFANSLLEKGVAMVPGEAFGDYKRHVRISLCKEETVLKDALDKICGII